MKKPEAQHQLLRHLFSKREEEGFTLVELIVVIIIMAILSQIGMVSFNRYTRRTRAFAAETAIRNIKRECEMNRDLGMDPTFTTLTPRGYSIQPDNSNNCGGGSGSELVTAIPDNQGEYPAYNYDFNTGELSCKYNNKDNLFSECETETVQKDCKTVLTSGTKLTGGSFISGCKQIGEGSVLGDGSVLGEGSLVGGIEVQDEDQNPILLGPDCNVYEGLHCSCSGEGMSYSYVPIKGGGPLSTGYSSLTIECVNREGIAMQGSGRTFIPYGDTSGNTDWMNYQKWLKQGGKPGVFYRNKN